MLEQLKEGILTNTPEETEAVGAALAGELPENVAVALSGDLGTGKTTLVRGIARGLGIQSSVTSPTYTVYTIYEGDRQLLHMDAYRLSDAHELDSLTIDEFLVPPYLIAVEWPEHIPGFFEEYPTYRLSLELLPDHRHRIKLD
ncbi:MAG: tRNA (adenosine(37)-N6)-threonylcarbamoyltransferase complex ATPase subunit type 1 TsaE [Puniceicoccaceae bacterium]